MNPVAQERRALKFQARRIFFQYRRPCLVSAVLLLCLTFAAQFFSLITGGSLFYTAMDVRQLPLDTGVWVAGPEVMNNLLATMGLQGKGEWGGLLLTLRYDPAGLILALPVAWRQLLDLVVVQAILLVVTAPLEYGVLAQFHRVLEGRPQRLPHLFRWYTDLRLTGKALGLQLILSLWRLLTTLVCSAPGFLCLLAGTSLSGGEGLLFFSTVLSLLGMLAAYYCYTLLLPAQYLLASRPELTVRQALAQGAALTAGRRWPYFMLNLSFLPWHALSLILYSAPELYALPYSVLSNYLFLEEGRHFQGPPVL